MKSVQKYEAQNINTTKRYSDGIPAVLTNGISIAAQIKQLTQEHRIALEVVAGNKDLLNEYRIKISALEHQKSQIQNVLIPSSL